MSKMNYSSNKNTRDEFTNMGIFITFNQLFLKQSYSIKKVIGPILEI